jgi:hypothetical protein
MFMSKRIQVLHFHIQEMQREKCPGHEWEGGTKPQRSKKKNNVPVGAWLGSDKPASFPVPSFEHRRPRAHPQSKTLDLPPLLPQLRRRPRFRRRRRGAIQHVPLQPDAAARDGRGVRRHRQLQRP